jgi:hypothetical protein
LPWISQEFQATPGEVARLRIFGFFPSKRADVEDSEIIERRGDLQVTDRMTTEHIAELKTLLESEAAAQQIVPD